MGGGGGGGGVVKAITRTASAVKNQSIRRTRPAWAGFKTAEEGRTKIM